jgi:hypothetical protein
VVAVCKRDTKVIIVTKRLEQSHYARVIALTENVSFIHYKLLAVFFGEVHFKHLLNGELGSSCFFSG